MRDINGARYSDEFRKAATELCLATIKEASITKNYMWHRVCLTFSKCGKGVYVFGCECKDAGIYKIEEFNEDE